MSKTLRSLNIFLWRSHKKLYEYVKLQKPKCHPKYVYELPKVTDLLGEVLVFILLMWKIMNYYFSINEQFIYLQCRPRWYDVKNFYNLLKNIESKYFQRVHLNIAFVPYFMRMLCSIISSVEDNFALWEIVILCSGERLWRGIQCVVLSFWGFLSS